MQFPHLLTLDVLATEQGLIPTAIAWTLRDGQYKSVFIRPEDQWLEELYQQASSMDISPEHLLEQGQSALDIARELEHDLEQGELYCQDPDSIEQALEAIFAAAGQDNACQCLPWLELFHGWTADELAERQRDQVDLLGLSMATAEEQLLVMRSLWAHENEPHDPTAIWHLHDGLAESDEH